MCSQGISLPYLRGGRSPTPEERHPSSKKVKRNYRLINLTAVLGKIIEQILLEYISGHMSEKNVMGNIISMDLACIDHA